MSERAKDARRRLSALEDCHHLSQEKRNMKAHYGSKIPLTWGPGTYAVLMPQRSRLVEVRVVRVPPATHHANEHGEVVLTPVMELAPAEWRACPEGQYAGDPFLSSPMAWREGGGIALDVLQAFVDLGYELGLTPKAGVDRAPEIAALRYHLEDLRKLTGLRTSEQSSKSTEG